MKVIADHQGAGGGSVEFGDDPRLYEFLVESSRIDWSISVQETFAPQGQAEVLRYRKGLSVTALKIGSAGL